MSELLWVFKPIGWNPTDCIQEIKKNKKHEQCKITFAGRLDPMAYGLMALVKVGPDVNDVKKP